MQLNLSTYSQAPIYEQIKQQIKELILIGTLAPNEQLPSIRVLAAQLNVGIITVKRAYEDLEKEAYIYNRQGKGCFVRPFDAQQIKLAHQQRIQTELAGILMKCKAYAIEKTEVINMLEEEWRRIQDGRN